MLTHTAVGDRWRVKLLDVQRCATHDRDNAARQVAQHSPRLVVTLAFTSPLSPV